jgi:hypothetical protein
VELLGHSAGIGSFDELWERSIEMALEGRSVRVASLDDLLGMKRAAGRPKDFEHIVQLEALKRLLGDECLLDEGSATSSSKRLAAGPSKGIEKP